METKQDFIKRTQEFRGSPRQYNREISEAEAVEIIQNTQEFFSILFRIQKKVEAQRKKDKTEEREVIQGMTAESK